MARVWASLRFVTKQIMRFTGLLLLLAVTLGLIPGCGISRWRIRECQHSGSLQVGQKIPSFTGSTQTGESLHSGQVWTNLTIYCVADNLPAFQLDTGAAVSSRRARQLGARVIQTGDGVAAGLFGLHVSSEQPFHYDTSLVVLVGSDARVLRIWRGAKVTDLDALLP